jgi:hypothetical protein
MRLEFLSTFAAALLLAACETGPDTSAETGDEGSTQGGQPTDVQGASGDDTFAETGDEGSTQGGQPTDVQGASGDGSEGATGPDTARILDRTKLGELELRMKMASGRCFLQANGQVLPLGVPGPCSFMRRGPGQPVTAPKFDSIGHVLLVAGVPAAEADYARVESPSISPKDRRSHIARAVFVKGGKAGLGPLSVEVLGFCPDLGLDNTFYRGVAFPSR